MRFWDTSAILPLLVSEVDSALREEQFKFDSEMVVWWGSRVECHSALARRFRDGGEKSSALECAQSRLHVLSQTWYEVPPLESVRLRAERLLIAHPLRAADALQLAAALVAVKEITAGQEFLTADLRLATAATREGFRVI
jgi:predicted nucleic acid-binding protein